MRYLYLIFFSFTAGSVEYTDLAKKEQAAINYREEIKLYLRSRRDAKLSSPLKNITINVGKIDC